MKHRFERRRSTLLALAAAPVLAATAGRAPAQFRNPEAGTDYFVLKTPAATESGKKVEVLDFFQYSCPHCFHFLPDLSAWKRRLASDVAYRYAPVVFDARTTPHARITFALEALKRIDDLHEKVFEAFHVQKKPLLDANEITEFMLANGIKADDWRAAYNSAAVTTKVERANALWRAYQVEGTPALGCDGRYVTAPSIAKGPNRALQVMDFLIAKQRLVRAGK